MTRLEPEQVAAWERRAREARAQLQPLPGVAPAARPLRIVLIGWARLSLQASEGSGYNLSVSELAAGLACAGHQVYYLRSGMDYSVRPGMWIKPHEFWRGVGCFDFINSPNLATANFNFNNVVGQTRSPLQTAIILDWLKGLRPDVVHAHSVEGFGLDLIEAIRGLGIPVIITPHNYYLLCPQVDLMHHESRVCEDYDGGKRCVGCLTVPDAAKEIRRRRLTHSGRTLVGNGTVWNLAQSGKSFKQRLAGLNHDLNNGDHIPITPGAGDNHRQQAPQLRAMPASPADQNERLLTAKNHLVVLNDYGRRRLAGVAALNAATVILAPSNFLLKVHAAMGVEPARLRQVRLGQPHFDALHAGAICSPFYEKQPWCPTHATGPLRFAFFGSTKYNKGLETLVRAIALVPQDALSRAHFNVRAEGDTGPFRALLRGLPQVSFLGGYDMDGLLASPGEFDVGILPTMGLENSPFVLLEHLHAGKFVIASRLGGPTDWITQPRNGLMFPAGNHEELAAAITRVIRGEVSIPSPREVHEASVLRSYPDYLAEVMRIYEEVAAGIPHTPLAPA